MVAYSFKAQFEDAIVDGTKRQTVRGFRKRHARPNEPMQLFTAMRTRQCRKILTPDPICLDVRHIAIAHGSQQPLHIEIEGRALDLAEIESFACADGFDDLEFAGGLASRRMSDFWLQEHGPLAFSGVVIRWKPA